MRIVIVDDHPLFRDGVASAFKGHKSVQVVGQGDCVDDALELCRQLKPDIMLLDIFLSGDSSLHAINPLLKLRPELKVVILTASENEGDVATALEEGARGYVLKGVGVGELFRILAAVNEGQNYVAPGLAAAMLMRMHQRLQTKPSSDASALSPRESEILDKVAEGLTNKEIALGFSISEKTVKHYMTNIMQKLNVRNRVEAVIAFRNGATTCQSPQKPKPAMRR